MATRYRTLMEGAPWRQPSPDGGPSMADRARSAAAQALRVGISGALLAASALLALVLFTHDPRDPSWNSATSAAPANAGGRAGALLSDLLLQSIGLAAVVIVFLLAGTGMRILAGESAGAGAAARVRPTLWRGGAAVVAAAVALGLAWPAPVGPIDAGAGGVVGLLGARAIGQIPLPAGADPALVSLGLALPLGLAALALAWWAAGPRTLSLLAFRRPDRAGASRRAAGARARAASAGPAPSAATAPPTQRRIAGPAPRPAPARAPKGQQQGLQLGDRADLPPLNLLKSPPPGTGGALDADALEQNARLLEAVLDDYGVRGDITGLAQGPVVTLYELEPAPGIKASRVIGLADDIARSMSAVSARVATIPGRNVIGIELPNMRREMVALSELVASDAFQNANAALPIVLGKDISGAPVVADLAPMPHLLIAGTTGSGKSVGLNAMILSLLYRLRPDQCRMIMIDPKMLELSVYDDIPHLLAPVVTEPSKAIRALKWAVEQMEERYRNMAHINVRSLSGYNEKVREALKAGRPFVKRVQTGWDEEGSPVFEDITLPLEPLPLIVVVVDELADLMMTAGKEVEFLIQRLAQKARAAGIHLIMATQRPSVDVITGVIKANLPTRISFQVTSKIDSRTILGEMGAEQLLGKGDMLYMPNGKQVVRVHGPFVSDEEVEAVAAHWKAQGAPSYVASVTEEPDGPDGFEGLEPGAAARGGHADTPLAQAIQVVATSRRPTISYLQRQMRIGYNSAARLIDQMEEMGLVSAPDHVGRREVLMDEAGNRQT